MKLEFSIIHHVPGEQVDTLSLAQAYGDITEEVIAAEELGYSAVWFAEHHFKASAEIGRLPYPLLFITYLAGQTRRIRLGTAVLLASIYHPVALAEQIAFADILTGGRLNVGLGTPNRKPELAAFGLTTQNRHKRLKEIVSIMEAAWTGEEFDYKGFYYQVPKITLVPTPVQSSSQLIWIAAGSHESAKLAAQVPAHLLLSRAATQSATLAYLESYRNTQELQKTYQPRFVQLSRRLYVLEDGKRAISDMEPFARVQFRKLQAALKDADQEYVPAMSIDADGPLEPILRELHFLLGDPDTVANQIREECELYGLTHLAFNAGQLPMSHRQRLETMEVFSRYVMPRFRN